MKKLMLLCAVTLLAAGTDVGKAANFSQNDETLIVIVDDLGTFEQSQLFVTDQVLLKDAPCTVIAPVFIAPNPVAFDDLKASGYLPYKEKKRLKTKFHAWHLFHPLKTC